MSRPFRRAAPLALLLFAAGAIPALGDRDSSPARSDAVPASPAAGRETDRPDFIRLRTWGKVTGWVLDSLTQKPVPGAQVAVEVDGAFPERGRATDRTDAAGRFNARAPLGSISSKLDWGRLLTMHPISLVLSPLSVTKQTKIIDATEVNVRVEAPGYQPFVGRVRATLMDPRSFEITLDDVWLAPAGAAGASFSPDIVRLEVFDSLAVEPAIVGPGDKVKFTFTTHLPVDRGFRYHGFATSTAIRLVDGQFELKREMPARGAEDPRRVVFLKEVTMPKTPVDRWTEIGVFVVRNDTTLMKPRELTALLQFVRQPEDRPAAQKVMEGYRRERAGDEAGALAQYGAARRERPSYTLATLLYGDLALRLHRAREAADVFHQLVEQDPRDYETARSRYAAALLESGRAKEALAELAGAESVSGKSRVPTPVSLVRARAYAAQGNLEEADRWLAKAGSGNQLPAEILTEINLKRSEAAVRANPSSADLRLTYARVLAGARRREEAVAQIRRAVVLESRQPWGFIDLGSLLFDLGQREEGLENLQHAVKLAPDNVEALLALADACRDTARYGDALALYRTVTERQKLNLRARHYYALMLYATGNTREARKELVEVIAQARDKGELKESGVPMAGLYLGPKKRLVAGFSIPEAAADLGIVQALQDLDRHPDVALLLQNIGSALLDLELPGLAVAPLKRSLDREPGLLESRFLLGAAFRKLGKADQAAAELETVLRANPIHPRARLELAQLYTDRGDLERAQDQLTLQTRNYPHQRAPRQSRSFGTDGG